MKKQKELKDFFPASTVERFRKSLEKSLKREQLHREIKKKLLK